MKLFSEQDQSTRQALDAHIERRWSQLYQLDKEWAERALKYLLMTNSGGAIATLGFLGAAPEAIGLLGAKIALLCFLAGIVLLGVAVAKTFHHMRNLFETWKTDVASYYEDRITWRHLQDEDKRRAVADWWDYGLPYASFASFVGGCIAGACSLLTNVGP